MEVKKESAERLPENARARRTFFDNGQPLTLLLKLIYEDEIQLRKNPLRLTPILSIYR